jgi:hypothetical protein
MDGDEFMEPLRTPRVHSKNVGLEQVHPQGVGKRATCLSRLPGAARAEKEEAHFGSLEVAKERFHSESRIGIDDSRLLSPTARAHSTRCA